MKTEQEYNLDYLASALEEATTTIRTRMDELSLVRRVGDAISSLTSRQALCVELVNAVAETVNCRYVSLYSGSVSAPFELQAVASVFSHPATFPQTIGKAKLAHTIAKYQTPLQIDDITDSPFDKDWPFPKDLASFL